MTAGSRTAFILTVSDRGSSGDRADTSGDGLAARLIALGFTVEREIVPDERRRIESMLVAAASRHPLIVTTGGTGLTPRDVTPQATLAVIDYQVPGFAEAMRADGRAASGRSLPSLRSAGGGMPQPRAWTRSGAARPGRCLLYTSDAADEEDSVDLG